ncbi:MAG TPA: FAD-binding oxidoreductase [Candidatus Lokiarchaeia archaeon]|nr:FAD-binding oxidoreductase [Candidatus Lokiarchaeia archaeon]
MALFDELARVVGDNYCSDKDYINVAYARSLDPVLEEIIPAYVVAPGSTEEVAEVVKIAYEHGTPLVPRGGGCCLMGGSKPVMDDTILLDMVRMDKILDIDEENHAVTLQLGLSWSRLNAALFDKGYYTGNMGPGSGLNAAVGGGLSHHSGGGGGCGKYGECTDNCLGLEVVLGTGEVITLGSGENRWVPKPFTRGGLGPDLMGVFLGDNGTMGVKTTATLKIFPKPPFFSGKTFLIEGDAYETYCKGRDAIEEMIRKGWTKHLGIYDVFFTPPASVSGINMTKSIKSWGDIHGAVLFYVSEAFDEQINERNAEILEGIVSKYATRELGPSAAEGNITDWFYGEQGHWQAYHPLFSLLGSDQFAATTEVKVPIATFPEALRLIDEWEEEHGDELAETNAESGVSHVVMLEHGACYIGSGLTASTDEDYRDDIIKLWKDQFEALLKHGSVLYMCGQIGSQVIVDSRMYSDTYYNFFKQVKNVCDPKGIISPGKFRFKLGGQKIGEQEVGEEDG